jgi:thiamine biosynthesis lipoprotein
MELKRYSFIVVLLAVASCQTHDKLQRLQGDALGTSYTLLYLDTAPNEIVSDSIDAVFLRMNQSMSTYWPNAIISKVNRDEAVRVDADFKRSFKRLKIFGSNPTAILIQR